MQAYDLIMLIVLGMATIFGAIKGFAWQVASIASVIASYLVAYRFRFDLAEMIQAKPPWNQFLAMLILYVGTSFVIWVAFRLLSGAIDRVRLKEFDRHLGAGFGLLKGLIYCLLITMFAMSLLGPNQQAAICQSRSGYYIASALDRGVGILPKEIHDVVGPYLANLDDKLKQHGQTGNTTQPGLLDSAGFGNVNPGIPAIQDGLSDLLKQFPLPGQTGPMGPSDSTDFGQGFGVGVLPAMVPGGGQQPTGTFPPQSFPLQSFPQSFPPLGSQSGFENTLRPAAPPQQQAQQPSFVLPR